MDGCQGVAMQLLMCSCLLINGASKMRNMSSIWFGCMLPAPVPVWRHLQVWWDARARGFLPSPSSLRPDRPPTDRPASTTSHTHGAIYHHWPRAVTRRPVHTHIHTHTHTHTHTERERDTHTHTHTHRDTHTHTHTHRERERSEQDHTEFS